MGRPHASSGTWTTVDWSQVSCCFDKPRGCTCVVSRQRDKFPVQPFVFCCLGMTGPRVCLEEAEEWPSGALPLASVQSCGLQAWLACCSQPDDALATK